LHDPELINERIDDAAPSFSGSAGPSHDIVQRLPLPGATKPVRAGIEAIK
jgi:hypothetical protein